MPPVLQKVFGLGLIAALAVIFPVVINAEPQVRKAVKAAKAAKTSTTSKAPKSIISSSSRSLGVGDRVTYRVDEDRDPPVHLTVTDTGELDIPYLGRVRVVGKSTSRVKSMLKKALEAEYYYTATVHLAIDTVAVRPTKVKSNIVGKVYLSGKVNTPGPQDLLRGEQATASKVILRAGGLSEFADARKVKVVRDSTKHGKTTIIVDIKEVLERGNIERDVRVYDGDLIIVPQRLINW